MTYRFGDVVESAKEHLLAMDGYLRLPSPPASAYSTDPSSVVAVEASVSLLLLVCHNPQIFTPIMMPNSVFMVNGVTVINITIGIYYS